MKRSTDRILTTHVGSLPRPPDLLAMLEARETGQDFDAAAFEARLARAVQDVVEKQVACGIDSVCDGERARSPTPFMCVTGCPASARCAAPKSRSRPRPRSTAI